MPRAARFVLAGVVHHVVARGANRQRIFASGFDKTKYVKRFARIAEEESVLVHGYCLMDNHVHWLITPTTSVGLARLFQRVHTWWAMVFNHKHDRTGHLFQSRYHSSALSESHYWSALRYVELNPKRAGLVRRADEWEFSSANAHSTGTHDRHVNLVPVVTRKRFSSADWRDFLKTRDEIDVAAFLRVSSRSNRPCGDQHWIKQLEAKYSRALANRPPGRPKRNLPARAQQNLSAAAYKLDNL